MALNIGDAVLTFFGNTEPLDQVFARLPAQTEAAMGAAAGSVGQLGDAVGGVNFELDATAQNVPYCGEVIKEAMGTAENSTHEARGEAALLGEAFGIHLPRHVRSFIGEIPGVSTALAAAFSATAIFFIIEALGQAIEKIQAFRERAHDVELAWDGFNTAVATSMTGLDDKLLEAGANLDSLRGNHLAALQKELEILDHTSLRDLVSEFDLLAKASDAMFAQLKRSWLEFDAGSTGASAALKDFKSQYDLLLAEGKSKEASDLLAGTLKSARDTLVTMEKENDEAAKQAQAMRESNAQASAGAAFYQLIKTHKEGELKAQETIIRALQAQVDAEKKISEYVNERKQGKQLQETNREEKEAEGIAKKEEQLFFEVAKAHAQAQKLIDKDMDDFAKLQTTRLNAEMKQRAEANKDDLQGLQQRIQAKIAALDGEINATSLAYEREALLLKGQYDKGLITAQQYLTALKALNDKSVNDLREALERKQQFVVLEAQNEAALRGKTITAEEAKELKAYIDLENKKSQVQTEFQNKFLKVEDQVTGKLAKNFQTVDRLLDDYVKKLRGAEKELTGFGKVADATLNDVSKAFGSAVEQWVSGQASFGAALKQALQQYLAQVAGKAAIDALYFTAWGIADTFWNPARAGADFAAAAEFAALAAVAGGSAKAIGGGGSAGGGGSKGSNQANIPQNASTQAAQPVTATQNVPRLFTGAIVTQPTLAMVGDNGSGGRSTEGIFRLDDPRAVQAARRLIGGGGDTIHNWNIHGLLSTQDLVKTTRIINRGTETGRLRVNVSRSGRVIKKG